MRQTLIKFLVAWLTCCAVLADTVVVVGRGVAAGGGGATYLVSQGFEGTGYDNSETWTEAGTGTIDEDFATAPGDGSQSLQVSVSTQNGTTVSPTFTAQATLHVYMLLRWETMPSGSNVLAFRSNTSNRFILRINSSGTLRITHGATSADTTDAMSSGTWYHVWMTYTQGTGADGFASVEFATTATKVGSGNKYQQVTTGTATTTVDRLCLGPATGNATYEVRYDKVRVDDAVIGSNPS